MKKNRWWILAALFALILIGVPGVSGQDSSENDLLRLLHFVPDTPETRAWLTFGDLATWHTSWNVPRIDNVEQLEALDRDPYAYWVFIMPTQTMPPDVLGAQYLLSDDIRAIYGFDLFNMDRFLYAGEPPDDISVVEFSFDGTQIANALTTTGYEAVPLETGGTLYQILGDYETDLPGSTGLPRLGMLGRLNRIALLDGQMVIGRATAPVTNSLATQQGTVPSLADDPAYIAAANAMEDWSMLGDLTGAALISGAQFPDAYSVGLDIGPLPLKEVRDTLLAQYQADPLPHFDVALFSTRHAPGATYLGLVLVFPPGTDAEAAAHTLANRLQTYTSLLSGESFAERWVLESDSHAAINGLPVAMVTMRVDDPEPAPPGDRANTAILGWANMLYRRDMAFLFAE
ncbi:MAG: hypothetical protein HY866_12935 [Chloroflexi bacterium]|nr:hypothetical protein [Chloroflexota bacterium]